MSIYNCDPEWPVCLFDFTIKNQNPTYLTFKVKQNLDTFMIHDYFDFEAEDLLICKKDRER